MNSVGILKHHRQTYRRHLTVAFTCIDEFPDGHIRSVFHTLTDRFTDGQFPSVNHNITDGLKIRQYSSSGNITDGLKIRRYISSGNLFFFGAQILSAKPSANGFFVFPTDMATEVGITDEGKADGRNPSVMTLVKKSPTNF